MEYDVFICHASEDKDTFVRPLASRLADRGLRVWFDEFTLRPGDSLRESIDRGLRSSRNCVVVLSPRFFARSWPEWELNGIVQRHLAERSILLPVWLDLSSEAVRHYSPSLADLVAIRAETGISAVAQRLVGVISQSTTRPIDARELLHHAMEAIVDSLRVEKGEILHVSIRILEDEHLVLIASSGIESEENFHRRLPVDRSFSGLAVQREAPVVSSDISAIADQYRSVLKNAAVIQSEIVAPLFGIGGDILGVAAVASTASEPFDEESLKRFVRVAAICGPLVEQLRPSLLYGERLTSR